MKTFRVHPAAKAELAEEIDYYLNLGRFDKADDFKAEMDRAQDLIQEHPTRWRLANPENYPTIRTYGPTKKFLYRIGYIEEERFIYILAFYYSGEADPLDWTSRADD